MGYKYRQGSTPDHVNSSDSNSTPTPELKPLGGGDIAKGVATEKLEDKRDRILKDVDANYRPGITSLDQNARMDSVVTINKKLQKK